MHLAKILLVNLCQIVWFTALFPYVVMFSILVRAVTLEGAGDGLLLYVTPDWSKLFTSECWIDSATQIFFAYSIGEHRAVFCSLPTSFNMKTSVIRTAFVL
jgi:SNF family Na+-dependent transporter